jgi:hypothetical protein
MELKKLSYLVSNHDIEKKFKNNINQIKIILYPQLNDVQSIFELLPYDVCSCFILLKTSENSGHWTCIVRYYKNIYYFDSYGVKADGELSKISSGLRYVLHENKKSLTRIIKQIPNDYNFSYNKFQFQKYSPNINTCGRWVVVFTKFIFKGYNLIQFKNKMMEMKEKYKESFDDIVIHLW